MPRLNVLFILAPPEHCFGGDENFALGLAERLRDQGVGVEICREATIPSGAYDLVHAFSLLAPELTSPPLCEAAARALPVVLTPFYGDPTEEAWAHAAVEIIYAKEPVENRLVALESLMSGRVEIGGKGPRDSWLSETFLRAQRRIVRLTNTFLPSTHGEYVRLSRSFPDVGAKSFRIVPPAIDIGRVRSAAQRTEIKADLSKRQYVLCVGRVERGNNQLLLLDALNDLDYPVVLAGGFQDAEYARCCREVAGNRVHFLGDVRRDVLDWLYANTRVHALFCWRDLVTEANLIAGATGASIATSNRGSSCEVFRDFAYYANPGDIIQMRHVVTQAWQNYETDQAKRERLVDLIETEYSWERAVANTLEAYEGARELRRPTSCEVPTRTPTVAIVLVTYQSEETLPAALDPVFELTTIPYELVLVDNASTDRTTDIAASYARRHPRFSVLKNGENLGYATAAQQGIDATETEFVVLLNPDVEVSREWLERLLDPFSDPQVAATGPLSDVVAGGQNLRCVEFGGDDRILAARTSMIAEQARRHGTALDTKLLIGFCLALRRSALDSVGGLDTSLFLGNDDLDLCWRLRLAGYRLRICGRAFVRHAGGASFGRLAPGSRQLLEQESLDTFWKKLVEHYGDGYVPSSTELWGFEILGIPSAHKRFPGVSVAIVFDDRIRPDTTGVHCVRALRGLCQVTHFQPNEIHEMGEQRFDLVLQIDDGMTDRVLPDVHPTALWAIDTHLRFEQLLSLARTFDYVFCAQRPAVAKLREAGLRAVSWLPLAADPTLHRPKDCRQTLDVAFVGDPGSLERQLALRRLKKLFPSSFIGTAFGEKYRTVCGRSKVLFNRSVRDDLNVRIFESLSMGRPLVTDRLGEESGLLELFEEGRHLILYDVDYGEDGSGEPSLRNETFSEAIQLLLDDPELRGRIADAGRSEVLARHTYVHRMEIVLTSVLGLSAESSASSPPTSTIVPCCNGLRVPRAIPSRFS